MHPDTEAIGYMLVLKNDMYDTIVKNWNPQFELNEADGLTILSLEECAPNTYQHLLELKGDEKHLRAANCMEEKLRKTLNERHPNATLVPEKNKKPLKVDWDYCAVI